MSNTNQPNPIFINAYGQYKNEASEGLNRFICEFPSTIADAQMMHVNSLSIGLTYKHPNISPFENRLEITLGGTDYTLNMPTSYRYIGASNPSGIAGYDYETELNALFQTETGISSNPFVFDLNNLKFSFDLGSTGEADVVFKSSGTFNRRIGVGREQQDTSFTSPVINFSNSPIVSRTQFLYIGCEQYTNGLLNLPQNKVLRNVIYQAPLYSSGYGDIQDIQPSFPIELRTICSFSTLTFFILDELGNEIEFNTNTNMGISLSFIYPEEQRQQLQKLKTGIPQFRY